MTSDKENELREKINKLCMDIGLEPIPMTDYQQEMDHAPLHKIMEMITILFKRDGKNDIS